MSTPPSRSRAAGTTLSVGYHRGLGVAALVVGILMLVLGVGTGELLNVIVGVVLCVLGVAYLVGKVLVLTPTEVQLKSPLGVTTERVAVSGPQDLWLGDKVLYGPDDVKIVRLGLGVDSGDVERLRAVIGPGPSPGPAAADGQ